MLQSGLSSTRKDNYMLHSFATSFFKEEDGQDLVEYSLLLAFIGLGAVAILTTVKTSINTLWATVNTKLTTVNGIAAAGK